MYLPESYFRNKLHQGQSSRVCLEGMALAMAVCHRILKLFLGQSGDHDPGHGAGGRDPGAPAKLLSGEPRFWG